MKYNEKPISNTAKISMLIIITLNILYFISLYLFNKVFIGEINFDRNMIIKNHILKVQIFCILVIFISSFIFGFNIGKNFNISRLKMSIFFWSIIFLLTIATSVFLQISLFESLYPLLLSLIFFLINLFRGYKFANKYMKYIK